MFDVLSMVAFVRVKVVLKLNNVLAKRKISHVLRNATKPEGRVLIYNKISNAQIVFQVVFSVHSYYIICL